MFDNLAEYVQHVVVEFSDADNHKTSDDYFVGLDSDIGAVQKTWNNVQAKPVLGPNKSLEYVSPHMIHLYSGFLLFVYQQTHSESTRPQYQDTF